MTLACSKDGCNDSDQFCGWFGSGDPVLLSAKRGNHQFQNIQLNSPEDGEGLLQNPPARKRLFNPRAA